MSGKRLAQALVDNAGRLANIKYPSETAIVAIAQAVNDLLTLATFVDEHHEDIGILLSSQKSVAGGYSALHKLTQAYVKSSTNPLVSLYQQNLPRIFG